MEADPGTVAVFWARILELKHGRPIPMILMVFKTQMTIFFLAGSQKLDEPEPDLDKLFEVASQ